MAGSVAVSRSTEPRLRRWNRAATAALLKADWTVHHDFLTIDLLPFFERSIERLDAATKLVTISDAVMGGTPVISGTCVPVHDVAAAMAAGIPVKKILEDYPSRTDDKLELAALYAEATPLRGRPKPVIAALPKTGTTDGLAEQNLYPAPACALSSTF